MAVTRPRLLCAAVLAIHLAGAMAAWWLLPHGFGVDDLHAWSNTLLPLTSGAAVILALVLLVVRRSLGARVIATLTAMAAGGWLVAVMCGALVFPISMMPARLAVPAVVALALAVLAWCGRARRSLLAMPVGGVAGLVVILAQRAPWPSTRPAGGHVDATTSSRELRVRCGSHEIVIAPLLTFYSRSPDRTWTVLAPPTLANDDVEHVLAVHGTDIDATSTLRAPIYSHLNSFTTIELAFDATVSFGPTGSRAFPIEPADYPSGRPMQLAYRDAASVFHVVRASDAEKGPFTELARGPLRADDPLAIEIHAGTADGCRIELADWASQASTAASPTAGWSVPQGTIQFFSQHGRGLVLLTLADTGPGRGFDAVGHAAGTYRNRIRITE